MSVTTSFVNTTAVANAALADKLMIAGGIMFVAGCASTVGALVSDAF